MLLYMLIPPEHGTMGACPAERQGRATAPLYGGVHSECAEYGGSHCYYDFQNQRDVVFVLCSHCLCFM